MRQNLESKLFTTPRHIFVAPLRRLRRSNTVLKVEYSLQEAVASRQWKASRPKCNELAALYYMAVGCDQID